MTIQIVIIIAGFTLLIKGASWMVDGATALARKHNISDLAIGLTIVAFGTSAPELVVNSIASFQNHYDLVFGNIIGSNNINLFLVLGSAGLFSPLVVKSSTVWREIPISFMAVIMLLGLSNSFLWQDKAVLSRLEGAFLLTMFGLFLYYVYNQMKIEVSDTVLSAKNLSNFKIWGLIFIGILGLVIGGKLVINSAVDIATILGVSEKIIGLTIVAAGTSLPELVTSVVAALKKNCDIAIGNIIGSNIFNIFLILSISAIINPVEYNPAFNFDALLLVGGTIFVFIAMFTGGKKKLDRWEAALLLGVYIMYTFYLIGKEV